MLCLCFGRDGESGGFGGVVVGSWDNGSGGFVG